MIATERPSGEAAAPEAPFLKKPRHSRAEVSTFVPLQKPVQAEKTLQYEIGADDSAADKTLLLEGWVFGTFRDREAQLAFEEMNSIAGWGDTYDAGDGAVMIWA